MNPCVREPQKRLHPLLGPQVSSQPKVTSETITGDSRRDSRLSSHIPQRSMLIGRRFRHSGRLSRTSRWSAVAGNLGLSASEGQSYRCPVPHSVPVTNKVIPRARLGSPGPYVLQILKNTQKYRILKIAMAKTRIARRRDQQGSVGKELVWTRTNHHGYFAAQALLPVSAMPAISHLPSV